MKKSLLFKWLAALFIVSAGICLYYILPTPSIRNSLSEENLATLLPIATSKPMVKENILSLVFAGDIMLDRDVRLRAQQNGYDSLIGPRLGELLTSANYSIANLEGPITSNQSISAGSAVGSTRNFLFTFAPESTDFLKKQNITIVNLGNNHILNFGVDGLAETYAYLNTAGIKYFGYTGQTQPADSEIHVLEEDNFKIGFVNYNQFISGGEEQTFADIRALSEKVDYIILYTHWGNEYLQENAAVTELAHRFIDAGVNLIIGSHPHIVNGHEVYKDSHIYYSLGNFIFDQYFDEEVKKGLVVKTSINTDTKEVTVEEHTIYIERSGQTELVD